MSHNFVEIYRQDLNNVGDVYSNPLRYFATSKDNVLSIDVDNIDRIEYDDTAKVIVGGGGLINNEIFGDKISGLLDGADSAQLTNMYNHRWKVQNVNNEQIFNDFHNRFQKLYESTMKRLQRHTGPKILWGAGHNKQGWSRKDTMLWPEWMKKFTLVGTRDYMVGYPWVPCASCMHPAFDKKYAVTNEFVFLEHKKQMIKPGDMGDHMNPVPRFVNSGNNFEQTISILGSANTVITNSYHGVYWATLLNKKVICIDPWSSKFYFFKHQPQYCRGREWIQVAPSAKSYPQALNECREANRNFWKKIQEL